jgi:hypothetical protein
MAWLRSWRIRLFGCVARWPHGEKGEGGILHGLRVERAVDITRCVSEPRAGQDRQPSRTFKGSAVFPSPNACPWASLSFFYIQGQGGSDRTVMGKSGLSWAA